MADAEQLAQAALRSWFGDPDVFKDMDRGQNRKAAQAISQLQSSNAKPEYHEWMKDHSTGEYVRVAPNASIPGPKMDVCVFCLRTRGSIRFGSLCSYGLHHEFQGDDKGGKQSKTEQNKQKEKKPDLNRCKICGLHPKNPQSLTNNCQHEYPNKEN